MSELRDVLIVGASAAGLSAARTLRRGGFGGRLTMLGAETRPPYKRPPLSKEMLVGGPDGPVDPDSLGLRLEADLDLTLCPGLSATGLDLTTRTVRAGSAKFGYDGLVIATGATPVNPWHSSGLTGVHVLRTVEDSLAVRDQLAEATRVTVVGAGFVGAEVASAARGLGREVTLVEALSSPHSPILGEQVGAVCAALHRDHGTDLRLGARVVGLEGDSSGAVRGVRLADGELVEADLVVVGIGVRPATDWLADSGLALSDGVVCDETCAAVDQMGRPIEGVVAAGDVARWPNPVFGGPMRVEHWDNAIAQGRAAARTLLGQGEAYAPIPYFWSDQYDTKIQFVGTARADDQVRIAEGDLDRRSFVAVYGRAGRVVGAVAVNLPHRLAEYRKRIWPASPFVASETVVESVR